MNKEALILGANGGVGGAIAQALLRRGWRVKALVRDPVAAARRWTEKATPRWIEGDVMDRQKVREAAEGCSVIVHAVNPPGYRDWDKLVLPMLESTIEAAKTVGARIVLPGNVYNFGPDAGAEPSEQAPQNPLTRKGRIRVEMERRLAALAERGAPSLIVRCGDFFGPGAANNWFSQGLVKPDRPVSAISYPGKKGIGHQWAYLPDVGETVARLLERGDDLDVFAKFHMEGHWDPDGSRMIEAIRTAVGRDDIPVRKFPWLFALIASPFVPVFRELLEMRYLWGTKLRMRNDRLVAFLGEEPHTDWTTATAQTLHGLGCLPDVSPTEAPATLHLAGS